MTVGNKQYNEADMIRMQHEAEIRVREMQNRARQAAESSNQQGFPPPQNRNWSGNPGMFRSRQARRQWPGQTQPHDQRAQQPPPPRETPDEVPTTAGAPQQPSSEQASPPRDGTIIGDIMAALGLDEDYLLIIGLILILINQRADTTLILALAYLLI